MFRSFIIIILFALFLVPFSPGNGASANEQKKTVAFASNEKSYQLAKFYYNELHTNTNLGKSRDNWLNGVRNFRKIFLAGPKSEFAAPSLYMLGRMYAKMYKRFHNDIDLQESISYYRDVSGLFPEDRLADDALYAVGKIYLNEKNNPEKAAKSFIRIIANYRNGDMYPHASDKLKFLSKEHNMPLPEAMLTPSYIENLSYVLPVKYWSSNDYTRVVIKASGPVTYQERLLEKQGDLPRRLYIDFQQSYIEPKYRAPVPIEDGLLKQIRTGQFTPETVRVVLDIQSISNYKIFSLPDPFRVVIDVHGESLAKKEFAKGRPQPPATVPSESRPLETTVTTTASEPPPTPVIPPEPVDETDTDAVIAAIIKNEPEMEDSVIVLADQKKHTVHVAFEKQSTAGKVKSSIKENELSLAQQLGLGIRKIVVDPGHGGKDPGASAFGLKEKDVVLKIGRKLAIILAEKTGAKVILTRDSDVFLPLEERTAITNTQAADLFISLHINAHPSQKVHGLETYYLNLSTNAEAMRVAAFENATSTHQMSDLQDILSDIMKNSKIHESSRLAGFVHNSLCNGSREAQETNFKNLGVKQAPFYVLIGAQMPAILIEIAFITNPEDSKHLADSKFLDTVVTNIAEGVQHYIHSTTAGL